MRIGILTLPLHTNYGGIMQAYALQTILEKMGHEVVVFDSICKHPFPSFRKHPLRFIKRAIFECLELYRVIFLKQYERKDSLVEQDIRPFIRHYIHRKPINKFSQLKSSEYDTIVVGSDQVWRPRYFHGWIRSNGKIENAYLSFAQDWNIKRVAYAASFGSTEWEYNVAQTERCKNLLYLFDAVSVREENGVNFCRSKFGTEATLVLDPTMLLNAEDYSSLFLEKNTPMNDGKLLVYVLDKSEELSLLIDKVSSSKCLKTFAVNELVEGAKPSIEKWIRGFYDADFVVTDSFHACVFSIIYKKQFLVVGNKKRGLSRFETLLKLFGLEDRLIDASVDLNSIRDINYDEVYKKYDDLKTLSWSFLNTHLHGTNE